MKRRASGPDTVRSARLHGLAPRMEVTGALRVRRVRPTPVRMAETMALERGRLSYEHNWLGPHRVAHRAARIPEGPFRLLVRVPVVLQSAWEVEDGFAALGRLARRMASYAASWDSLLHEADENRAL